MLYSQDHRTCFEIRQHLQHCTHCTDPLTVVGFQISERPESGSWHKIESTPFKSPSTFSSITTSKMINTTSVEFLLAELRNVTSFTQIKSFTQRSGGFKKNQYLYQKIFYQSIHTHLRNQQKIKFGSPRHAHPQNKTFCQKF